MQHVVMRISGTVFRVEGTPGDYNNNSRPSARSVGGFAICEVVLAEQGAKITRVAQPAELQFLRVVQFEDGLEEIDLYDGSKLVLKFRPKASGLIA